MERPNILSPIVRWAQSKEAVTLSIDLSDVKDTEIDITETSLSFKAFGHGAHGENYYQFQLDFQRQIKPKQSTHNITDRCVQFSIIKKTQGEWPRLLTGESKPAWLKIDFDKWKVEDSADEEDGEQKNVINKINIENRMKGEYDRAEESVSALLKFGYLAAYNIAQGVAFWTIISILLFQLARNGTDAMSTAYDDVSDMLLTCQLAAFLEIINAVLGVVNTGVLAPCMQVGGRNFILLFILVPQKQLHSSPVVFVLFLAWSLIEAVRYPFYAMTLCRFSIGIVTWLRYTIWVVLYPIGLFCEVVLVYKTIPLVASSGRLSFSVPNIFNFGFSFSYFLIFYIGLTLSGGAYLMKYLLLLRRRKLGPYWFKFAKRD